MTRRDGTSHPPTTTATTRRGATRMKNVSSRRGATRAATLGDLVPSGVFGTPRLAISTSRLRVRARRPARLSRGDASAFASPRRTPRAPPPPNEPNPPRDDSATTIFAAESPARPRLRVPLRVRVRVRFRHRFRARATRRATRRALALAPSARPPTPRAPPRAPRRAARRER